MKLDLAKYRNKKICVAVSGGRDSVALLHYLNVYGFNYGITLCAVNCDHMLRGEASKKDSAFVENICAEWGIPLERFKNDCAALAEKRGVSVETAARDWRRACYFNAADKFNADAVATAHHMNDNAETVLFNMARGAALSGVTGITDGTATVFADKKDGRIVASADNGGKFRMKLNFIRPLIGCSRADIDGYIAANNLSYVEDETNLSDGYTRNYIRHNVIPPLEKAVPCAVKSIYRFSRLAEEDEKYFEDIICEKKLLNCTIWGVEIYFCREKPVFMRAAVKALKILKEDVKDYTFSHIESLYELQTAGSGKKFEFLNFVAFSENGKIVICCKDMLELKQVNAVPFCDYAYCGRKDYFGQYIEVCDENVLQQRADGLRKQDCPPNLENDKIKTLKFDWKAVPETAAVRFMQAGDKFTKFGGGTKKLGDYFTDKKIPVRLRGQIPLVADGNDILIICGVEISDKVKVTDKTETIKGVICADYVRLSDKND